MLVFIDRTENVPKIRLFPDRPCYVGYQGCARVPRDASFPVSKDNYRRKQGLLCTTWDQLYVRTISPCVASKQMMITLSLAFTYCNKNISSEHISTGLSVSSSLHGMHEKTTFGSFEANSFFNLVTQSSVNCFPFFSGSNILPKMSNCHHTCFSHWSHHLHDWSAVRDGVGQ